MRILTITNWYPPHHRGGYESSCADVMTRLVARGHEVLVLCSNERLPGVTDGPEPVPVRREIQMYWKNEAPWRPPIRAQVAIERHNQDALDRALADHQPDVVSAWHMAAFSLNLLTTISRRNIPIVYSMLDVWPSYTLLMDPWTKRFRGAIRGVAGRAVERALDIPSVLPPLDRIGVAGFCSAFTRDDVRTNSPWRFANAEVIHLGIDREALDGARGGSRRRKWGWHLVYLGRFDPRKGTDTLLRAMPLLPEASLAMYGRGGDAERERLQELARSLGVGERVSFGSIAPEQIGDVCREADCVVFPSEWPEPFGLVPLEAMECGTPVVATGTGGSAEFLDNGVNCLLMKPGDSASLAAAVQQIAADPALRDRLRKGGRETAAGFDVSRTADGYERMFEAAIRRTGAARQ